jgi:tetratricopeptide (TPR) repeat protein
MKSVVSVIRSILQQCRLGELVLLMGLLLGAMSCDAAEATETREFNSALALFNDQHYGTAERDFAELVAKHPQTLFRPDAILYQARSRLNQGNFAGGLDLLHREQETAGNIADRYRFFIGEGFLGAGRFREAAAAFASLRKDFPESAFGLETFQRQATALAEAGDWPAISELLLQPDGAFLKAVEATPGVATVVQGLLLAAEAEIRNGRPQSALAWLGRIPPSGPRADLRWKKQLLQARARVAEGPVPEALEIATNLVEGARELRSPEALAVAGLFHARVLASSGLTTEALGVLEGVLDGTTGPAEPRREALAELVRIKLERGDLDGALARLKRFVADAEEDPAVGAALLAASEIRLRQSVAIGLTNSAAAAELRKVALADLQSVVARSDTPVVTGRTWLQIGWAHWLENRFAEARSAFGKAVDLLPPSEDATVAAFKSGDCELALGHPQAALDIYRQVEERLERQQSRAAGLLDELEFQRLRAALNAGNLSEAEQAVTNLAATFATSELTARATVLLGVHFSRNGRLQDARKWMETFIEKNPASPYRDQAELVIARSLDRENKWNEAAAAYDAWIKAHPDSPQRPKVEYLRADSTFRSGNQEGALAFFSNLASERKDTEESLLAENWLATYFWNDGKYAEAQKHYQLLYSRSNCPPDLSFEARMMAGRAAFESSDFKAARDLFLELIASVPATNPPVALADVYFALGDTISREFRGATNALAYIDVGSAFRRITTLFPDTPVAAAAFGRLGEVHVEWANRTPDATVLAAANQAFQQAIAAPKASRSTVQRAKVRLGGLRELEKKPDEALDLYLDVVYAPEEPGVDLYIVQEAGLSAARLLRAGGQWGRLVNLCERLIQLVPAMQPALAPSLDEARVRMAGQAG